MKFLGSLFAVGLLSVSGFAADIAGVHNFNQINGHIYRGAQPTNQGFQSLAKLGVKTVIDLRESGGRSLAEKKIVEANGMRYVSVPLNGFNAPSDSDVAKLLAMLDDSAAGPVFIHCRRGADRTGTILACYRISHDHWQNDRALSEAKLFRMSSLERAMQHYVLRYKTDPSATSLAAATSAAPAANAAASVVQ